MARSNTPPAWRRAFLRELARSGSVARAAEKCGIDRTTPYPLRKHNPAFAASWDRALATARARLAHSRAIESPPQGDELRKPPRLRDDEVVRASRAGRPCIVRAGPGRWSARAERAFLAELAASANVSAAARAAGVSAQAAYNRRKRWPAFAAAWAEAKAEGYERLELLLLHAATATLDPEPAVEAREAPAMTVDQALNLFKLHRAGVQGGKPQRYGWRAQEPDIEDVRAEILRKVAAMERARG
ncbi:MAG TPA: hypothetical protein VEB68_13935 [Croceibacterium sp.]|nr:hypothetical protein [Croceibacterium sp.]